jgi:ring-1,2-phenylacetyl-CoA epoxidase subunit PaaC
MNQISHELKQPLASLLLALADDKLMLGHRNSDWTGLGPILEEDIAFSHLAQDEIAHAQAIYEFVGTLLGRSADDLAFGRLASEFRCASIVEVPDEFDWATAMARKLFCDHFDRMRLRRLSKSSCRPLAELAARLAAEEQLHVEHVDSWMVRLGRGGEASRARLQHALENLAPLAPMLFEAVDGQQSLIEAAIYPHSDTSMFRAWHEELQQLARHSTLQLPALQPPPPEVRGGRRGSHTPHLEPLLIEMTEVWRMEPGAAW